jgi:hypothetical protein
VDGDCREALGVNCRERECGDAVSQPSLSGDTD